MKFPLLAIDVHYMAHRAFYVAQHLSYEGKFTGVIFQFLKSITFLKDEFQTDRIAFCFEHPHLLRRDLYPAYKQKRTQVERTPEEKRAYLDFIKQIQELRTNYLPRIGFKNIFCADGYEADDHLAALAVDCPEDEEVILITADTDLLQCLRANVTIYSPQVRKLWTVENFQKQYGIRPQQWAVVKALAGCGSDEVKGIPKVGEITAIKYLRGELRPGVVLDTIRSAAARKIVRLNRQLVELPFKGCPVPQIQDDKVSAEGWKEVCGKLGMKFIASKPPTATRRQMTLDL